MSDEEKLAAIQRREEQERATQADLEQMDAVLSGTITESQIIDNSADIAAPVTEEMVVPEESAVPDATGDEVVAEGEPDLSAPVEPAQPVEPDDGYDFSDFINSMARDALGKQPVVQPVQEQPVAPTPAPVAPVTPQQMTLEVPQDLISLDDMNEAFQDPAKMIALIGKVYLRAASDGAQAALIRLPNAVRPVVAQEAELAKMVTTFYEKNPELSNYRDFVQYCAAKVETEHPEYSPSKVMEETAKVAVARLPMVKEAAARQKRAPAKPSFIGAQNQRGKNTPAAAKMSALDRELAEMPDKF